MHEEKLLERTLFFLLSKKDYLKCQMEKKLLQKGFSEEAVQKILEKHSGYFHDEELLSRLIERNKEKGFGPRVIEKKLYDRGIKRSVSISPEEQEELIRKLLRKRVFKMKSQKQKIAFLLRRGFDPEVVFRSFKEF